MKPPALCAMQSAAGWYNPEGAYLALFQPIASLTLLVQLQISPDWTLETFPPCSPSVRALCCVPEKRRAQPITQPIGELRGGVGEETLLQTVLYSRRVTPRVDADDAVYAFWYCNGQGDLSRVRNLNLGGIFIETSVRKDAGTPVELHFLVSEGQIRAKAAVCRAEPGHGLGLKFTSLNDQDRLHFGALMRRLYSARCAVTTTESVGDKFGRSLRRNDRPSNSLGRRLS